jgi:uracil-DNA glycosylase
MGPAEQELRRLAISTGHKYIPNRGNTSAPCVIIGEAPGADEEREGLPFVGASGRLLTTMAGEAGLTFADYWVTNVYKVRPPDNDLSRLSELNIPPDAFRLQLIEELYEHKPTIIIAAGATPLGALCPDTIERKTGTASISKWRGSLLRSPLCNWPHYVVPITHPAFVLREWAERPVAVLCIAKAKEELDYYRKGGQLQPLPARELIVSASADTVKDYIRSAIQQEGAVSNDIETIYGKYPYTMGIACSPKSAISFSFWDYNIQDLVQIWRLLDELLRTKEQIGQNYITFDCHYLEALLLSPRVELADDTLIRHHVLWPEFEHKLQFMGLQYTREPYWKDEGKLWGPREGMQKLQRYNALDAAATYEIYQAQEGDFDDRPYLRPFARDYVRRLAHTLFHIENRGILVDRTRLSALREDILRRVDAACTKVEAVLNRPVASAQECNACPKDNCKCGARTVRGLARANGWTLKAARETVLNLGSPKQLIEEFEKRRIKVPKKRGAVQQSVDEEVLRRITINNPQEPLPGLILDVRKLNKVKGTYVETKLLNDVLYSAYKVTGTDTGRRSSSENVFGFGTNAQNMPKHTDLGLSFRHCLVSRPGKIFVEGDQKGAEDWIVQGIIVDNGGDRRGMDELLSGINRHKRLASFLFTKPESEVDKAGMHYYAGKKTRHAGNYDMQADKMSVVMLLEMGLNMPPAYCEWLLKKFHEHEPGIRQVFHKYVEDTLSKTRTLRTPLGRERVFFGCRPASNNADTFRQAYAYIPQSTVGDNTGMATVLLGEWGYEQIQDVHDSALLEVDDTPEAIQDAVEAIGRSFDRDIVFPNGTTVNIPIEFQIGYNQRDMRECHAHPTLAGLIDIQNQLKCIPTVRQTTTTG